MSTPAAKTKTDRQSQDGSGKESTFPSRLSPDFEPSLATNRRQTRRRMVAAAMLFVDAGPVEDETAAESRLRFDRDVPAMLAEDLLAHGQAQPRSAGALCRFEDVEDLAPAGLGECRARCR